MSSQFYHLSQGAQVVNAPPPLLEGVAPPCLTLQVCFALALPRRWHVGGCLGTPFGEWGVGHPHCGGRGGFWAPLFLMLARTRAALFERMPAGLLGLGLGLGLA